VTWRSGDAAESPSALAWCHQFADAFETPAAAASHVCASMLAESKWRAPISSAHNSIAAAATAVAGLPLA